MAVLSSWKIAEQWIVTTAHTTHLYAVFRDGQMGLTLDPQLVRDLTTLITSSGVGGMVMEAVRQPVINGYFIAGSVVGPGGFKLIKASATSIWHGLVSFTIPVLGAFPVQKFKLAIVHCSVLKREVCSAHCSVQKQLIQI